MPTHQIHPTFADSVKSAIKAIPCGKVATYGQIAAMAGNPRASRQVARILYACSRKNKLPWHRVINSKGTISLKPGQGYELQKALLGKEGVAFGMQDRINLSRYLWQPN